MAGAFAIPHQVREQYSSPFTRGEPNSISPLAKNETIVAQSLTVNNIRNETDSFSVPSKEALLAIYADKGRLGAAYTFVPLYHWCSAENSSPDAWVVLFTNGTTTNSNKTNTSCVRCVRVP